MSSLYLHIPFCSSKCQYCDFYSGVGSAAEIAEYVELLQQNITLLKKELPQQSPLTTIFFGGGTPSLLSPQQLNALLATLRQTFGVAATAEISIEANPGTLDLARLQGYRQAGVNRLSLGIQSFDDRQLAFLGRIHSGTEARQAFAAARQAGFDNISVDLMFALPGQGLPDLERDLSALLELHSEHISLYGLTIEEETPLAARLAAGEFTPCDEDTYSDQYRLIHQRLTAAGFEHYEISNFARPGRRCAHNLAYWKRRSCLAVGCGGHSFYETGWGERWLIPSDLASYRSQLATGHNPARLLEDFDRQTAMKEYAYLALRTADGLARDDFAQRFSCLPEEVFSAALNSCQPYLLNQDGAWRFDLAGWLIYDHLISHFL
ncbi:radical SAM family heme chaperone HemW [Pelobacter seleniigenes]|uniref:radical SAM family heme chaperone HemW n=1 Tax=Pelobacter seleniigenes TaxID=407188 RepID=UPI0004A6BC73|nr:radical SAM family heme chaperone HemW [Pelobacter seleniigenes]